MQQAKVNCETCIFLGDWHHSRVNVAHHHVNNVRKLSEAFEQVYMITGNPDLYYREKRDYNSFAELFDNVHPVNEQTLVQDDVALVPWLVGDEWTQVSKTKCRYMFGHFELSTLK